MKIDSYLQRGYSHVNYCEDSLVTASYGDFVMAAVMDGCSSGADSHFIATYYGKVLRKSFQQIVPIYKSNNSDPLVEIGKYILEDLFYQVKRLKSEMALDITEILTTSIILVANKATGKQWINTSGDGLFIVDGKSTIISQNNMPDFMGYHLDNQAGEWIEMHTSTYELAGEHLILSTDGVQSFTDIEGNKVDILNKFVGERQIGGSDMKSFFAQLGIQGIRPYDDVAIVSLKLT